MTTKRRKAEKLPLPQTTGEAIDLIAHYADLDATLEAKRATAERMITNIRALCDAESEPLEAELKLTFNRLKPWWELAGDELTGGKRKSIELGGCQLGHRTTPPRLIVKGAQPELIDALIDAGFDNLFRTKRELYKPAIIDALRSDDAEAGQRDLLIQLGFAAAQKEEFFIDRLPPKAPAVEIVADQVAA